MENDKLIEQVKGIKKEIKKLINSATAIKETSKVLELSFHEEDDDEETDVAITVVDCIVKYINLLVPLAEEDMVLYKPVYDCIKECWVVPMDSMDNCMYGLVINKDKDYTFEVIPYDSGRYYSIDISKNIIKDDNVN